MQVAAQPRSAFDLYKASILTELEKEKAKQRRRRQRAAAAAGSEMQQRALQPVNAQSPPHLSDAVLREQFDALDDAQRAAFEHRATADLRRSEKVRTQTKTNLTLFY